MTVLPGVVVRAAAAGDEPALVEGFLVLNRFEEPLARNRRTDREGAERSLAAASQRVTETGGAALVAESEGALVGHLFLVFETDGAYVREELRPYGSVTDFFVRDGCRGRGIGTALMRAAEQIAARRGVARLVIGVLAGNDAAARLYLRLGFAPHALELSKPVGHVFLDD